jgi:CheY-like chemotaxis protein
MKKTIVVADRDESLQHAFMTVFSKAHFEIVHASNGREVEKIAEKMNPDIYIVNVDLPKISGIEVYKKLQKQKLLDRASFYFLKDESDTTELLGYQGDGVIEKPINFFRVYEMVTREDDAIELTDLVDDGSDMPWQQGGEEAAEQGIRLTDLIDEKPGAPRRKQEGKPAGGRAMPVDKDTAREESLVLALTNEEVKSSIRQIGERLAAELEAPSGQETVLVASTARGTGEEPSASATDEGTPEDLKTASSARAVEEKAPIEEALRREAQEEVRAREETKLGVFGDRLRDAMDSLTAGGGKTLADTMGGVEEMGEGQSELEAQLKTVLNQAMEEAALKLSARLAPILTQYVEDYVKRMLLEIAEKVIREEIEKLLRESTE